MVKNIKFCSYSDYGCIQVKVHNYFNNYFNDNLIFSELDDVAKLLNKSDSDSSGYLIFLINKCLTITVCLLCVYNGVRKKMAMEKMAMEKMAMEQMAMEKMAKEIMAICKIWKKWQTYFIL